MATKEDYSALGLGPNAPLDDVKRAYRRMVKETHPDTGGSAEAFREVHLAYERIKANPYVYVPPPGQSRWTPPGASERPAEDEAPTEDPQESPEEPPQPTWEHFSQAGDPPPRGEEPEDVWEPPTEAPSAATRTVREYEALIGWRRAALRGLWVVLGLWGALAAACIARYGYVVSYDADYDRFPVWVGQTVAVSAVLLTLLALKGMWAAWLVWCVPLLLAYNATGAGAEVLDTWQRSVLWSSYTTFVALAPVFSLLVVLGLRRGLAYTEVPAPA